MSSGKIKIEAIQSFSRTLVHCILCKSTRMRAFHNAGLADRSTGFSRCMSLACIHLLRGILYLCQNVFLLAPAEADATVSKD